MAGIVDRAWGEVKSPLYRNALYIMSASIIGSALGFFFLVIATRFYRETDVGYAAALFQTVSFLAALAHLGLGTAIVRYLPENKEKTPLVNTCLTIVGTASVVLSVVFILGVQVWAPSLDFIWQNFPVYPIAIVIAALAVALPAVLDQAGYAMRHAEVLTWRTLTLSSLKIPLVFFMPLFFIGRLGVFLALALSAGVAVVVEALVLLPRVLPGYRPTPHLGFHRIRPMFRFSIGNYVANSIVAAGSLTLTLMILNVLGSIGAKEAAFFYVAQIVAGLLYIIPTATFTSFFAEASQKGASRHRDERRAIGLTLLLLLPAIAVFWVFAEPVLTLFGSGTYADGAVLPLRILVLAAIPVVANNVLGTRIKVRKRSAPLIVGSAIMSTVTLALGFVLLSSNGIDGLAAAVVIGQTAPVPYYYLVARRSFQGEPAEPLEPKPIEP